MESNPKILVVDDEPDVLFATSRILRKAGYNVIEAETGKAAIQLARNQSPDLVLLDLVLPDMDGNDVCRVLKNDSRTSGVYIAIISGKKTTSDDQALGLEIGADEYIVRPISTREFLARVKALLRLRQVEQELECYRDQLEVLVENRTVELQRQINERQQSEKALLQSKKMLARTESIAHIGSWEWEIATDTVIWSEEMFRIFQLDPTDKAPCWSEHPKLYHPEDFTNLRKAVEAAVADGTPYEMELRAFRKDGETRVCLARGFSEIGPNGKPIFLFGLLHDITERKEAEKALENEKKQWKETFDAVSEWVTIIDQNHHIIRSNIASERFFNSSPDQVAGKLCYEVVHETDCPIQDCPLKRGVKSKRRENMEIKLKDGRWILVSVDPLHNENDDLLFVHTVRDITDRKQAEAAKDKHEAQKRQFQKAESLARMAGAVAHHFNNQLSVVLGNLELLQDTLLGYSTTTHEYLTEAIKATRRSADLSSLMLTYLSQNIRSQELLDLSETCRSHMPVLRNSIPENISLETDFRVSGPFVHAGSNEILKLLTQLTINGVEAIGDRQGRLALAARTLPASDIPNNHIFPIDWQPADERYACLEVADTGDGINEQDVEKIFDPFFTTKFTGRGLGLSIALGIVKAWGGGISVETRKGHGTTFRVLLPMVADEATRKPEKAAKVHKIAGSGTVLLVEDQVGVRQMAEKMLKRLGFSVLAAAGGAEAIEIFQQHRDLIRCVITDLTMPDMDGWQTIAALRKIRPDLSVVLASGYDEAEVMSRDKPERPNAFLHKPYSMDELKKALNMASQVEV